ncbi:LOW QUALITY PROTEIN: transketolase-like protein 1 [Glossophaga mutica]
MNRFRCCQAVTAGSVAPRSDATTLGAAAVRPAQQGPSGAARRTRTLRTCTFLVEAIFPSDSGRVAAVAEAEASIVVADEAKTVAGGESWGPPSWGAWAFSSHYSLDNLIAIFDVNNLGYRGAPPIENCMDTYQKRCEAFGNAYVMDGYDVEVLWEVFWSATRVNNKPTIETARTFKGRDIPSTEDAENQHGKPMPTERVDAIVELTESQVETNRHLEPKSSVGDSPQINITDIETTSPPGDKVNAQRAHGLALAKLSHANHRVLVLDGGTKNTFSEMFKKKHPECFSECFLAGRAVNVALGCPGRGRTTAFVSTFAAFLTRALDQIRIGTISQSKLAGSHCRVSADEDGPSPMALEDVAMFSAIPSRTIFHPSDAISTEHAVFLAAHTKGMRCLRTNPETDVIYTPQESCEIGPTKVIHRSVSDKVTVIAAGVTLHEVLAAADALSKPGISIHVIGLFAAKPLDAATIISNAKCTGGRVIAAEDHHPEGGVGEAVGAAVSMEPDILDHWLAVQGAPQSGRSSELLDVFGISAEHIVATKCISTN